MITTSKVTSSVVRADAGVASRRFSKAKAIAQQLGVYPRTIFRWADDGKITRHKINARVVLFDEGEVLAMKGNFRLTPLVQRSSAESGGLLVGES